MDVWEKSMREDHHHHKNNNNNNNRRESNNPSFSSTLLDAIYRSIDEPNGKEQHDDGDKQELFFYEEKTMRKKLHSGDIGKGEEEEDEMESMRRACMIERWMEKKTTSEKVILRRKSMADFERNLLQPHSRNDMLMNSSSSSSDSSCGGGFSSSESDSFYKDRSASNYSTSCYSRLRPIRTSISTAMPERYEKKVFHSDNSFLHERNNLTTTQNKPKKSHENGFVKTKSKALKIYSDLKRVKQPISPGGRLASFINSLLGNAKKAKISTSNVYDSSRNESISTCSTASSFSRSCLSNTPSSRGKLSNNGMKRSVRFCPVSVIVDEDCRPCGHKSLYESSDHVMSENRRVAEAARELLKSYHKKKKKEEKIDNHHGRMMIRDCDVSGRLDVEDDDDDAASYASSDLFELDSIGIERYREELPVYETTHVDTNRAIASGLIL